MLALSEIKETVLTHLGNSSRERSPQKLRDPRSARGPCSTISASGEVDSPHVIPSISRRPFQDLANSLKLVTKELPMKVCLYGTSAASM